MKRKATVAPPTMPNMIARWLCTLCFFWGTIVTCGASIGEFDDASSHDVVENVRHKLPDVLQKYQGFNIHAVTKETSTLIVYLISNVSFFKDCGSGPCSLLFSRFLQIE